MRKKLLELSIVFTCIFLLTGCGKKNPISNQQFKNAMEDRKFTNYNIIEQYKSYGNITSATAALNDNKTIQIEFYLLTSDDAAMNMFDTNKAKFENTKGSVNIETNVNLSNNSKYTLDSNNKYMVVSRIDNTLIYVSVKSKYKDEVKQILKDINY